MLYVSTYIAFFRLYLYSRLMNQASNAPLYATHPTSPSDEQHDAVSNTDSDILVKERTRVEPPSLYKVILLNDDYTPMEFVVGILESLFYRSYQEAVQIMFHVHNKGVGICGLYPHEVAETKAAQVMSLARKNEHPLQCVIEKEAS